MRERKKESGRRRRGDRSVPTSFRYKKASKRKKGRGRLLAEKKRRTRTLDKLIARSLRRMTNTRYGFPHLGSSVAKGKEDRARSPILCTSLDLRSVRVVVRVRIKIIREIRVRDTYCREYV